MPIATPTRKWTPSCQKSPILAWRFTKRQEGMPDECWLLQASGNCWGTPHIPCVQKRGKTLATNIRDLANRYSDIIIDAGGQDSVELRAALMVAHLAVFPIQPSLFDAATLETLATLVNQAQ